MCQQQPVNLDLGDCVNYQTANAAGQEIIEAPFDDVSKSSFIRGGSRSGHELFLPTWGTYRDKFFYCLDPQL